MIVMFSGPLGQQEAPGGGGGGSSYLIGTVAATDEGESITATAPAGTSSGDLLIFLMFEDAQRGQTLSAGWTELHRVTQSFGSDRQVYIASRTADGTAADNATLTHGTATDRAVIVAFPSGATVLDSAVVTFGSDATPASNDGTLSGGSGDWVIWGQTCQTNFNSILSFPTPSDDTIGPTAYGTETFAVGIAELTAGVTSGDWTNNAADNKYLTLTVVVTP